MQDGIDLFLKEKCIFIFFMKSLQAFLKDSAFNLFWNDFRLSEE